MVDVRQVLPNHPSVGSTPHAKILLGYVSVNQPAPATFAAPIFVIVPNHSTENAYGPLSWTACNGAALPAQGSPVVLGIDENGTPHVLTWTAPYTPPALPSFAGPVSDANFPAPPANGTQAVDSTDLRLYVRVAGAWRYAALT